MAQLALQDYVDILPCFFDRNTCYVDSNSRLQELMQGSYWTNLIRTDWSCIPSEAMIFVALHLPGYTFM